MSELSSTFSRGMPVEIGDIDRELKKLWEFEHGAATRASLVNLAVYCEGAAAMDEATELIAELTQSHACRAILIATEPDAPQKRVQAWISAHCHLGGVGTAKQICCEQISLLLSGDSRGLIPNLVFSHLDSDLPLYLWWRARFCETLDAQLLSRVDRLIFDSQTCSMPKSGFHHSLAVIAEEKPRLILCDLNWTRTLDLRQALAQLFDHPDNLALLGKIENVTITHSPPYRCTAILLAGWLTAQLGWKIEKSGPDGFEYSSAEARGNLKFIAGDTDGAPVSECALSVGAARFSITREPGSEFFQACICTSAGCERHHLLPAGRDDVIHLLNKELALGGRHQVYLLAIAATEKLWQANFQ
jgi:glucose-6-phosphate dehydrogenase assembly protein OpcA